MLSTIESCFPCRYTGKNTEQIPALAGPARWAPPASPPRCSGARDFFHRHIWVFFSGCNAASPVLVKSSATSFLAGRTARTDGRVRKKDTRRHIPRRRVVELCFPSYCTRLSRICGCVADRRVAFTTFILEHSDELEASSCWSEASSCRASCTVDSAFRACFSAFLNPVRSVRPSHKGAGQMS